MGASLCDHCSDVITGAMATQITSLTIVYWTVNSGADQRKQQSSASLAFVRGIHRWPVNSLHKWPVTRKMFPFDDVIMWPGAHRGHPREVYLQTQGMEGWHGKGSMSTWRRPSSWSPVLAMMSSRNLASARAVCHSGVSRNSILCSQCMLWVHKT